MRILFISQTTDIGGATIALKNIVTEVSKRYVIGILMPSRSGWLVDELSILPCKLFFSDYEMMIYPTHCICKYGRTNPIGYLKFIKAVYNKIVKQKKAKKDLICILHVFKPDIVHCNCSPLSFSADVCHKLHIPHVWHIREYSDLGYGHHLMPSKGCFFRKMTAKGNYCIAITKGIFQHFKLREGIDKVIYDGVFDEGLCPEEFKLNLMGNYFLSVGRIEPAKGTLELIESFARFHRNHSNVRLLLVGGFSNLLYLNSFKEVCKKYNIENVVFFCGVRDDVFTLMQHAIALIVASPNEGFGFSATEAMLNSCIVIGRNTAGIKEQFDKGLQITGSEIGLRYNTQEELIMQMNKAICRNYDTDMKQRAYSVVIKNYTIQVHVKSLMDYYLNILKNCRN